MGHPAVILKERLLKHYRESLTHLQRLETAMNQLQKSYNVPFDAESFHELVTRPDDLAYADQVIYRFSKLQDCMGAKLFRALLDYEGENTDRPFLDLLNRLEKMDVLDVDFWFELREIRNEIAHDYDNDESVAMYVLNMVHKYRSELDVILNKIAAIAGVK